VALFGGASGLHVNQRLIAQAPEHLRAGGLLALELGSGQGVALQHSARKAFPKADVSIHKDLAGLERVLTVRLTGEP